MRLIASIKILVSVLVPIFKSCHTARSIHTQATSNYHHSELLFTSSILYQHEIMPSVVEDVQAAESIFTPKVKAKLAANAEKASRDFRSDVVTVPTEDMMNV